MISGVTREKQEAAVTGGFGGSGGNGGGGGIGRGPQGEVLLGGRGGFGARGGRPQGSRGGQGGGGGRGGAGGGTMEARGNRGVVDSGPRVWKNRVQFPAGLNAENCPNYPYCVYSPSP